MPTSYSYTLFFFFLRMDGLVFLFSFVKPFELLRKIRYELEYQDWTVVPGYQYLVQLYDDLVPKLGPFAFY